MSLDAEVCQFCRKQKFRYTCPKCNALYCSVNCYKSPEHLKCSEEFYKSCIQDELASAQTNSSEDMRKIYDILKRIRESDAGIQPEDFADGLQDPLDSDDDQPDGCDVDEEGQEEEEDEEADIASRLKGIDINDSDEVWQRLTPAERENFQRLVECGDIMQLLPDYRPWWCKQAHSKIVELPKKGTPEETVLPSIAQHIAQFADICKKPPSPCLHYNLWNILAAYACMVRFYGGEHLTNPAEAAAQLVNLSTTLKYGTNFEDVEDAIISVQMEALTTPNNTASGTVAAATTLVESRDQLQSDARQLMSRRHFKLAALSDMLQLLQLSKKLLQSPKANEQADFQKLFALCSGSVELNRKKLQQLAKKMEFFLSYVQRDAENDL